MSFVKDFIKTKKLDDDTTFAAAELRPPKFYVDTGSYVLNGAVAGSIYKGIPSNGITGLAGQSGVGKTFYSLEIVKHFLDANPTGEVVYFESEKAIKKDMLKNRGIDESRMFISEVVTVQEFRTRAVQLLDTYKEVPEKERTPLLIVLDSLGNLSTTKELEDTASGKETQDMTRAKLNKSAFRVLTLKAGQLDVPIIVTAHTYSEIGAMYPQELMGGGTGLQYCASTIIFLSKRKEKDGTEVIGNVISARMFKSRDTKPDIKVETMLNYTTGLNKYYGLLELAEEAGIFKKNSTRYEVVDETTGEVKLYFGKAILDDPERFFTKSVLDKIDTYAQKMFKYGGELNKPLEAPHTHEIF